MRRGGDETVGGWMAGGHSAADLDDERPVGLPDERLAPDFFLRRGKTCFTMNCFSFIKTSWEIASTIFQVHNDDSSGATKY